MVANDRRIADLSFATILSTFSKGGCFLSFLIDEKRGHFVLLGAMSSSQISSLLALFLERRPFNHEKSLYSAVHNQRLWGEN
jgi:hypothetical protein